MEDQGIEQDFQFLSLS